MKKIPVSLFALIFVLVAVFCAVSATNNNKKAEAAVITEEWFTGVIPSWKYGTATMPSESTDVSTTSPSTWYSSTWYDESMGTTHLPATTTTRNYSSTSSTATTYNYDMTTPTTTTTWYYGTTTTLPQVACNNYEPQTVVTTKRTTTNTGVATITTRPYTTTVSDYTTTTTRQYNTTTTSYYSTTNTYYPSEVSTTYPYTEPTTEMTTMAFIVPDDEVNHWDYYNEHNLYVYEHEYGSPYVVFGGGEKVYPPEYAEETDEKIIGNNWEINKLTSELKIYEGADYERRGWRYYGAYIKSVTVSDEVDEIGDYAFSWLANLESVDLGDGVKKINEGAFFYCSSLTEIEMSDNVEVIGEQVFCGCTSLEDVKFGIGLKEIGKSAFDNCIALYSIDVPDSVEVIGDKAFANCLNLKSIKLGSGIKKLGKQVFYQTNYYLNEDNWENNALYIGEYLIKYFDSGVDHYEIKEGTRIIAPHAFREAEFLKTVTVPESVEVIGLRAFEFSGIESFDIHEGIREIGNFAFSSCKAFAGEELVIPASVESIGAGAFWNCGVTSYSVDENNQHYANDSNGIVYSKDMKTLVLSPSDIGANKIVVPESVTEIADFAFSLASIEKIELTDNIERIGAAAFATSQLKSIDIPDSVTELGNWVLYGCYNLKTVVIGDGVKELAYAALAYTTTDSIEIGKSIEYFWGGGFYEQSYPAITAKYVVDPKNQNLSSDDYGVVYNKRKSTIIRFPGGSSIEDYVMPSSVENMYSDAFAQPNNLKSITFSESFSGTGDGWLSRSYDGINTEKFIVPEGNPYFSSDEYGVLYNKDKTTLIAYPQNRKDTSYIVPDFVETIQNLAFYKCENLTEAVLPDKPMLIYSEAFYDSKIYHDSRNWEDECFYVGNHLVEITGNSYQSKVLKIREGTIDISRTVSFSGDTDSIIGIYIPKSLKFINESAFWWAYNLQNVYYPGTQAEWEAIDIVYHGNELLWDAVINCYATDIPTVTDPVPVIETIKDEKTGVSIEIDSSKYDGPVKILVEENIEDKSAFDIITTQVDVDGFALYDIKIAVDGVYIQPKDTVTVRLPLPQGFDASRSMVFYVNTENGEVERMNARFENGYMVFETDHFSYYAIVEAEAKPVRPTISFNHGDISVFYKSSSSVSATASQGKVVYSSTNPDVASVDANGNITAKKVGTAVITATIEGTDNSASCNVTVKYAWWQWIINILLLGFLWY